VFGKRSLKKPRATTVGLSLLVAVLTLVGLAPVHAATSQSITFAPPSTLTPSQSPYTLSATATSGLPVTFASSTTGVCTVSGSTLTLVSAGTCSLTANQSGNTTYAAAATITRSITVGLVSQDITFAPPSTLTMAQTPYTLGATATSGLPVTFASSTTGVCTVSGRILTLVSAGTCSLTANQAGNTTYAAAATITRSITVGLASQSIFFQNYPPSTMTLDAQMATLGAWATSLLPVTFASSTAGICTVSGSTLTLVSAGTCSLVASQAGNTIYARADAFRDIIIRKATQTIIFAPPTTLTLVQSPHTLSATASSSLGVVITSNSTSVCTVDGEILTLKAEGTCSVTASQAGNTTYEAAINVLRTITITKETQTITFNPPASLTKAQSPYTFTASASSSLSLTYATNSPNKCTVDGDKLIFVNAGKCTIVATQAGNSIYFSKEVSRTFNLIYSVGDIGPGGGIIYYVNLLSGFPCGEKYDDKSGTDGGRCNYLEVAPQGWASNPLDPKLLWAAGRNANPGVDVIGLDNNSMRWGAIVLDELGKGWKNSKSIVDQNGLCESVTNCGYAAGASRLYSGGGKLDWYLPTITELKILYRAKASGKLPTIVFENAYYWSSSESNAVYVFWVWMPNGGGDVGAKLYTGIASRPVRSF